MLTRASIWETIFAQISADESHASTNKDDLSN